MLARLRAQLETPIIQVVIGVLVIGVGGIGWTLTQTANFWFGVGFLVVAFAAAELLLWRLDVGLPRWVQIGVCALAAVLAALLVPGLLQQYQQLHAKPLTPDDIATAVWNRAPKPTPPLIPLPTDAIPPSEAAKPPKRHKLISGVSSVAPSTSFRWSAENAQSPHIKEFPYAIRVTLSTDRALSVPSIDIICDGPIERGTVSAGYHDPTKGGEATMVTGAQNEGPDVYHFVLNSPVFTPDILVWVTLEAKQPFRVVNVHVKELTPPTLSQTMVNSPGSTQVGGNLTINNKPPERTITAETAKQMMAVLGTVPPNAVGFTYVAGDLESIQFANRLADIFKVAGWRIVDMGGTMHMSRPIGLHITPATDTPGDPTGLAIKAALELAGGPVGYSDGTKHVGADTCKCYLIIVNYAP